MAFGGLMILTLNWTSRCYAQDYAASGDKRASLSHSANAAIHRESARQQRGFCAQAVTTAEMNGCLPKELTKSNANYEATVTALGTLLQLVPEGGWRLRNEFHGRAEFIAAEKAWKQYRSNTCHAIADQDDGGSGAPTDELECALSLTGGHVKELASTYRRLLSK